MTVWEPKYPIDYSPTGDDIDGFSQKVRDEFTTIYTALNRLRKLEAIAGLNVSDAEPYQWHIDTTNGNLYARNATNTDWILMGHIDQPYFGINAESIGAAKASESMGGFYAGTAGTMPSTPEQTAGLKTNSLYLATDQSKIYRWDGMEWVVFLSLQFADLLNYEEYCVARNELATSGAGKVLMLDPETGKGNINITGSPDRLLGFLIDVQNLQDDHVLCYDSEKGKIVNKPRNDIKSSDVAFGEAGKILRVGADGKITVDTTGSADKIVGLRVDADNLQDGQVFAYDAEHDKLVPVDKDHFTDDDVSVQVTYNKLVKGNLEGKVDGSITGTAEGLHGIPFDATGLADGTVIRYHASDNSFHVEPVSAVGDAASLVLTADGQTKIDYNGSTPVSVDMADILGPEYLNILRYYTRFTQMERELANVVLQMEAEGMMPDCNLLLAEDFENPDKIDQLTVKVTSCAAGDDSVDVELNYGLIVGSWYWITDGVNAEYVQVKSIIKNGNIHRLILTEPLVNTYEVSMTSIYRTTAWIKDGVAFGSGDVLGLVYDPKVTWRGIISGSSAESDEEWQTGLDYRDNFTMQGDLEFNADGLVAIKAVI